MLSSQDLRFLQNQDTTIPQRSEVIVSRLQPHFVSQTANGLSHLILRFRSKGGEMDSVRQSMNSDVVDVFSTNKVKEKVLEILNEKLGFDVEFVETPYSFYLIKWNSEAESDKVTHLDSRQDDRVLTVNRKYVCDTSIQGFNLILPRNQVNKDYVIISDKNGTFKKHPLTIIQDGSTIFDKKFVHLNMPHQVIKLTYIAHSNKWVMDI